MVLIISNKINRLVYISGVTHLKEQLTFLDKFSQKGRHNMDQNLIKRLLRILKSPTKLNKTRVNTKWGKSKLRIF